MGATLGNVQAGPQWSDLFLDGDDVGSTLSVILAEEATSDSEWECVVRARTKHGSFFCGSFRTRPPSRGENPARLVAIATFPGAVGWSVQWRLRAGTNPQAAADCVLASDKCCGGGGLPGVTPILSGGGANANRNFETINGTLSTAITLGVNGALLFSVEGQMGSANVAGTECYVLLFDQPAAPAAGDVPIWSQHVGQGPAAVPGAPDPSHYRYDASFQGRPVVNQLWIATSLNPFLFAASAVPISVTAELSAP